MANGLKWPFQGQITQRYGQSAIGAEPEMYASGNRCYWNPYPGGRYVVNWHPGIDLAAAAGTPILASEDGVVEYAGWGYPGLNDPNSGYMMIVRIRGRRAWYRHNHLSRFAVKAGDHVKRGQVIGWVGMTGAASGPHTHFELWIERPFSDGIRKMLYNPVLYMVGGSRADAKMIRPR